MSDEMIPERDAGADAQFVGYSIDAMGEAIASAIAGRGGFDPLDRGHDIASALGSIAIAINRLAAAVEKQR